MGYDKVVCSINLFHFLQHNCIGSVIIKGAVDRMEFWKKKYSLSEVAELKYLLLSPECSLKHIEGKISFELDYDYEEDYDITAQEDEDSVSNAASFKFTSLTI